MFYMAALIALFLAAMVSASPVLIPLAFSLIFAFALAPVVLWLEKFGLGRLASVLSIVAIVTLVTCGMGVVVGSQLRELAQELPNHTTQLKTKLSALRMGESSEFARLWAMWDEALSVIDKGNEAQAEESKAVPVPVEVRSVGDSSLLRISTYISPAFEPLAKLVVVVVLVVFMLLRREDLRNRFLAAVGSNHLAETTRALTDTTSRLSRYLFSLFMVNLSFGVLFGLGLAILGVPYAVMWGLFTTVFRFVPYVGSTVSMLFPAVVTLATMPSWYPVFGVIAIFSTLEFLTGNIIEPWLFGHSIGVNPVGVVISILFWTWAWGGAGLVLAVPLTVVAVSLGRYVPRLSLLTVLLGDEPPLSEQLVLYQRLLAGDALESGRLCGAAATSPADLGFIDTKMRHALSLARREYSRNGLSDEDIALIYQTAMRAVTLERLPPKQNTADGPESIVPADNAKPSTPLLRQVLGLAIQDKAEAVMLQAIAANLPEECSLTILECNTTMDEPSILQWPEQAPECIVVSVLPAGGLREAIVLVREAHHRYPQARILFGYWTKRGRAQRLRELLTDAVGNKVFVGNSTVQITRRLREILRTGQLSETKKLLPALVPTPASHKEVQTHG